MVSKKKQLIFRLILFIIISAILGVGIYTMNAKMLMTSEGMYTNAIYGFLSILFKLLNEENPDYICVAFDLKAPTKRHEMYSEYKGTRKGMPEELAMQMPIIKKQPQNISSGPDFSQFEGESYNLK